MKPIRFFALILGALSLNACSTVDGFMKDVGNLNLPTLDGEKTQTEELMIADACPSAQIVEELGSLNEFVDITDPQEYNRIASVHMMNLESACRYNQKSMTVDLKLAFEGQLGPRARLQNNDKPFFSYPFFVAVTAPNGDILAKEVFSAAMTYDTGQNRQTYYESLRQIIPISDPSRGGNHKVLIGFQLAQHQLAYNRAALEARDSTLAETTAELAKTAPAAQ